MRFVHLFLAGCVVVILGVGLGLWQAGVFDRIAPVWAGIGGACRRWCRDHARRLIGKTHGDRAGRAMSDGLTSFTPRLASGRASVWT